ncbi:hypothetical protein HMPREF3122_02815 [Corynebacterium sp. HMSC11H10]|nr:hypothetical protein [Corynebacterium amycolatum]MBC6757848.1 hypothetical protein [Corynebacterium sp. LK24]OFN09515.1 hypothetical protein HMPREF2614_02710 [Corynebacterium sp. HMSC074C11]OFR94493.1 hypothetical protein HMPREF2860_10605 [Corynebacterium sp. HMSC064E10]OFU56864.1 hypothetical protein HMPREF3122_02815 [Corynebacterium sp. HMSC11H10]
MRNRPGEVFLAGAFSCLLCFTTGTRSAFFLVAAWVLAAFLVLVLGLWAMKVAPLLPKAGLRFTRSGLLHSNRLLAKLKPS